MRTKQKSVSLCTDSLSALFCVNGEMKQDNGEDCYYYAAKDNGAIVATFDGCGGIGSRRYNNYSGKTGAYIASRAVCGAVKDWFETECGNVQTLPEYIKRALSVCDQYSDKQGRLLGSLGKSFPTTAAIIHANSVGNNVEAECFWAGDSRCYLLDKDGLHQLSSDDVNGEDALSNISGDGVLTNVICASHQFRLHQKKIQVKSPCILFSASDGCFGYLSTPMEFEYVLTSTLLASGNIAGWRAALNRTIAEYTGDDYTLCVSAFGFEDFSAMKTYFAERNEQVNKLYIQSQQSCEEKWQAYKVNYSCYL